MRVPATRRERDQRQARVRHDAASSPAPGEHRFVQLQRALGNQAVQGMVRTEAARLRAGSLQRASALDQHTSDAERKKLQVLSTEKVADIPKATLKEMFTSKDKERIEGLDDVVFGPGIDAKIQPGLQNVAGRLYGSSDFRFNSVTSAPLNLKPFGGVDGVYRFTLIERKTKPKRQLIIELVSSSPPADPSKIDLKAHQKRFDSFDFKLGSGFGTDDMKKKLFAALNRIPDATLGRIRGVTFILDLRSQGDTGEAGHYDPNTHTIHLFRATLDSYLNRADALGADFFTYSLVHEVSHAVDFEAYTRARVKRDTLAKQLKEAQQEARRISVADVGLDADKAMAEKQKKDAEKIKQLEKELDKAEKEYVKAANALDEAKGGAHTQSKAFKDVSKGTAITKYSEEGPVEHFAELYSMYILDPTLLQSLRPEAYKYFAKTFP